MLKNVTFFVNFNLYESKRYFTEKFAEAMNRKGIKTKIIDVQEQELDPSIAAEIKREKPDLTCSFNSFHSLPNQKFLWDILEIPHLSLLVDPALYSIYLTNSPYSILSCVDQSDVQAVKSNHFDRVFFLPHAIESDLTEDNLDRVYDIVLLGSCYDYESLRTHWQKEYPQPICHALDDAIEIVLSKQKISLAEALVTAWNRAKLPWNNIDFMTLFYYVDNYSRGKDRIELVRSIKNVQVHIFGELVTDHPAAKNDWNDYLGLQSNVTIHSPVSFGEGLNILKQSRICLNSMPFFKQGSHERVFASLACGALPFTSYSSFWEEHFVNGEDLVLYDPGNWETVDNRIQRILQRESLRKEMVSRGRDKVMEKHTWDNRVDQLLNSL